MEKPRNGSVTTKRYIPLATPCDRVIQHGAVSAEEEAILAKRRATLDPMALLHTIREAQSALAAIVSPELRPTPQGESATELANAEGPFEGVWCDVLDGLQEDPDASVVALLGRLQETEPNRFIRAHLRTLQRRVQQWRGIMADNLVYAASGTKLPVPDGTPEIALTTDDPKC